MITTLSKMTTLKKKVRFTFNKLNRNSVKIKCRKNTQYMNVCNQCLSPVKLGVRISIRARRSTLYDKVCQCLETGRWFSPVTPVLSTNKTDRHDITEILLKAELNTIKQTNTIYDSNVIGYVTSNFIGQLHV